MSTFPMGPDFAPAPQGPSASGQEWPSQPYPGQGPNAPQQPYEPPQQFTDQQPPMPGQPTPPAPKGRPSWGMLAIGLAVGLVAGAGIGYVVAPKGGTPIGAPTASSTDMAPEAGKVDSERGVEETKKPGPLAGWELRGVKEGSGSWVWNATYRKEDGTATYIQTQAIRGMNSWDLTWVTPAMQYDGYKCGVTQNGSQCIADYTNGMVSFRGAKVPPAELGELAKGWFAER